MKKLFILTAVVALSASLALAQPDEGKKTPSKTADTKPTSKVALNPQPLPPGAKAQTSKNKNVKALNPQPLPPGAKAEGTTKVNPQPLPPGSGKAKQKTVKSASDSTPR